MPFAPKAFLPISTKGVQQGDVAMVMGFPGRAFRYHDASSVGLAHDVTLPWQIDLSATRIAILEEAGKSDRALELQYASRLRGMANSYKNFKGVLEGMQKADFLSVKRAQEADLAAFVASTPDLQREFGDVISSLQKANGEVGQVARTNALFTALSGSVDMLGIARRVNGFVERFAPDEQGNTVSPTDEERTAFRDSLMRTYTSMNPGVDRAMLEAMMRKSAELPSDQRIAVFDRITRNATGVELQRHVGEYLDDLYAESRITTPDRLADLLKEDADDILDDPFVRLRRELAEGQTPVTTRMQKAQTAISHERGRYIDALMRMKKTDLVYPDANRTLRFGYGLVTTLEPRDAVKLGYRTTLRGVMEKEDDETPFLVPPRLRELWERKDFGPYAENGDVTVAFLATLDNTGGSSGSPVINGRGELIGCAFDGNWEGVLGDYYYQERLNRAICVDARYMLFILDKFAGAKNILQELVIR